MTRPTLMQRLGNRFRKRTPEFKVPVLCYHSWTMQQPGYQGNDHVAMAADLKTLAARGYSILPVTTLAKILRRERSVEEFAGKKLACITFDDGNRHDFYDAHSDELGETPSFRSILKDSLQDLPQIDAGPRAISFVIASAQCRKVIGEGDESTYSDDWWLASAQEGLIGIANHSWDHLHEALDIVKQRENRKGSFYAIDSREDANAQILDAHRFISEKTKGLLLPIFGYPYGHVSEYLSQEFLPAFGESIGIQAAFSTSGECVTAESSHWDIPRYVCGHHWKSEDDFSALLDSAEGE